MSVHVLTSSLNGTGVFQPLFVLGLNAEWGEEGIDCRLTYAGSIPKREATTDIAKINPQNFFSA
jgi:hypothetical protein